MAQRWTKAQLRRRTVRECCVCAVCVSVLCAQGWAGWLRVLSALA